MRSCAGSRTAAIDRAGSSDCMRRTILPAAASSQARKKSFLAYGEHLIVKCLLRIIVCNSARAWRDIPQSICMRAVCWNGKKDVRVETVDDPRLLNPRDAIVETELRS